MSSFNLDIVLATENTSDNSTDNENNIYNKLHFYFNIEEYETIDDIEDMWMSFRY